MKAFVASVTLLLAAAAKAQNVPTDGVGENKRSAAFTSADCLITRNNSSHILIYTYLGDPAFSYLNDNNNMLNLLLFSRDYRRVRRRHLRGGDDRGHRLHGQRLQSNHTQRPSRAGTKIITFAKITLMDYSLITVSTQAGYSNNAKNNPIITVMQ